MNFFILNMQKLLYSYWDTEGKGINLTYLTTYSNKLIFDSYNRSFFTEGKALGNHFVGSYHGEIFNDFEHNSAYADYGSVHGHHRLLRLRYPVGRCPKGSGAGYQGDDAGSDSADVGSGSQLSVRKGRRGRSQILPRAFH